MVVLAAAGGAWWLLRPLDAVVKDAIQKWGREITGVAVRVDGVKIDLAEGRATIRGLTLGNPKGFQGPHALTAGRDAPRARPGLGHSRRWWWSGNCCSLAPEVAYERGQGSDNLTVIQKNVDAWVAKNAGAKKGGGPGRKFIIDNVIIHDGKAQLGASLTSPIPELRLRDVGRKAGGANAGEAVKQVFGALLRNATELALRTGGLLKEGAPGAGESAK